MMTEKPKRYFRVRVTRDITESADIPVMANSEIEAADRAASSRTNLDHSHRFSVNEGNALDIPYLGDWENDIEEIDKETYLKMMSEEPSLHVIDNDLGAAGSEWDPDRHAKIAQQALRTHQRLKGGCAGETLEDQIDNIRDLVTDLLHLARRMSDENGEAAPQITIDHILESARRNWSSEQQDWEAMCDKARAAPPQTMPS